MSEVISYKPGDLIIKEGEDEKGFFILHAETLNVIKGEKVVRELKLPGTIIGEMSDILGREHSCNVKAETDSRVVYLSQGIDKNIRTRHPSHLAFNERSRSTPGTNYQKTFTPGNESIVAF